MLRHKNFYFRRLPEDTFRNSNNLILRKQFFRLFALVLERQAGQKNCERVSAMCEVKTRLRLNCDASSFANIRHTSHTQSAGKTKAHWSFIIYACDVHAHLFVRRRRQRELHFHTQKKKKNICMRKNIAKISPAVPYHKIINNVIAFSTAKMRPTHNTRNNNLSVPQSRHKKKMWGSTLTRNVGMQHRYEFITNWAVSQPINIPLSYHTLFTVYGP